jgi:hypothetical protein
MVDPRAKGARGEIQVRDMLRQSTGLQWERTPGSGALDEKHGLKGDLYVPNKENLFCVEVKNYEGDHLTSHILTDKDPQLITWWEQAVRQGTQVGRKPLLIFKFNRSKIFVAYQSLPMGPYRVMFIDAKGHEFYVALLGDWLKFDNPQFVK